MAGEGGVRNDLGSLKTLVPFHVRKPSALYNNILVLLISSSPSSPSTPPPLLLPVSQQGDEVRLVGHTELRANG